MTGHLNNMQAHSRVGRILNHPVTTGKPGIPEKPPGGRGIDRDHGCHFHRNITGHPEKTICGNNAKTLPGSHLFGHDNPVTWLKIRDALPEGFHFSHPFAACDSRQFLQLPIFTEDHAEIRGMDGSRQDTQLQLPGTGRRNAPLLKLHNFTGTTIGSVNKGF